MIQYFASDLVKRAEELADLENSDFISFREKIALLNEAYQTVYQKAINKDNNDFVRYINTRSKVIPLPPDFYQLKAVTLNHDKFVQPVLRRPANGSFNDLSYDIINNVLQINGEIMGANICIEYYPTPVTLTFPNKDYLMDGLEDLDIIDIHGSIYLVREKDANNDYHLFVRDLNDSTINEEINITNPERYYTHIEDDFITLTMGADEDIPGDKPRTYLFDLDSFELNSLGIPPIPVVFYKGKTYGYNNATKQLWLPLFHNTEAIYYPEEATVDIGNCQIAILSDDMSKYVGLYLVRNGSDTTAKIYVNGTAIDFEADSMYYWKDKVFLSQNGTKYLSVYDFQTDTYLNELEDMNIINIAKVDDNTGYGMLGKKRGKYYMTSFYDDTLMNFPNNTYFVYMSYVLALAFKTKQGSDITELSTMATQAEHVFFDTLSRDDWNSSRITNVY